MRQLAQWLLVVMLSWLPSEVPNAGAADPPATIGQSTRFTVSAPGAKTVAIAGSFNGWSPTVHPMTPEGKDGTWSALLALPSGEHTFMYVIDGQRWMTPPVADDFVDDGFGQINGIVVVR